MANKYLDITGVSTLWGAIKAKDSAFESSILQKINGIKANDETEAILGKGSSIIYNAETNKIELLDSAGNTLGNGIDATLFTKDGILQDVSIVTAGNPELIAGAVGPIDYGDTTFANGEKFIKFSWNTDAEIKDDYLKVDEIGKTYKEDNENPENSSITISTDNTLSVNNVGSDKTKVTSDINIIGGPLETALKTIYPSGTIPAGATLQEILLGLACTELWPKPAADKDITALSSSISAPTVSNASALSTVSGSKLYKVGATVTLPSVSTSLASYTTPKVEYINFSYGFATSTGKHTATKTETNPATVTGTVTTATNVTYTLSRTIDGFNDATKTSVTKLDEAPSIAKESATISKGTNSISYKLSVDKIVHTATLKNDNVYYALSNLGNTNDKQNNVVQTVGVVNETYKGSTPSAKTTSTYYATGVYPIVSNATFVIDPTTSGADASTNAVTAYGKTGTTGADEIEKLSILTNGSSTFYLFIGFGNGGFTVKLPSGWKITSAQTKSDTKSGYFDGNQNVPAKTVEDDRVVEGNVKDDYNVYQFNISAANVIRLKVEVESL